MVRTNTPTATATSSLPLSLPSSSSSSSTPLDITAELSRVAMCKQLSDTEKPSVSLNEVETFVIPKGPSANHNLVGFFSNTTPVFPESMLSHSSACQCSDDSEADEEDEEEEEENEKSDRKCCPSCSSSSPADGVSFQLSDLWSFYDEPYGHEVPITTQDGSENFAFYVPYLSAIQLYRPSHEAGDNEKEEEEETTEKDTPLFEYFETAKPDQRIPLTDKVRELAHSFEAILTGRSSDFDMSRSWYAISWYPILCDHYISKAVGGCFLTYHHLFVVDTCPLHTHSSKSENASRTVPLACDPSSLSSEEVLDCTCMRLSDELYLSLIGAVMYKVCESTWMSEEEWPQHAYPSDLTSNVNSLLRNSNIQHPDHRHMTLHR